MHTNLRIYRVGTRASPLARVPARYVIDLSGDILPAWSFEEVLSSSPGDRAQTTDLRISPVDFFTRDIDTAVLRNEIDVAVHSAKDLPDHVDGLDWFWLPDAVDRRDALVLPAGQGLDDFPDAPRAGVSRQRRADWCRPRWRRIVSFVESAWYARGGYCTLLGRTALVCKNTGFRLRGLCQWSGGRSVSGAMGFRIHGRPHGDGLSWIGLYSTGVR